MLMMHSLPSNSAVSPQHTSRWSGKHTRGKPASGPSNCRWWSPSIRRMTSVHASALERWMEVNRRSEVNRIPECWLTKHSRCSEVEIEDIVTSHRTSADKVKAELNHISYDREISITIPNHDYSATEPRWQSTIDICLSRRRSNKFSNEGDCRARSVKSYRRVESPPARSLPRHAPRSWSASLRSRPRFYWSRLSRAQLWSRPDCHQSGLRKTIAEYRWLPAASHTL